MAQNDIVSIKSNFYLDDESVRPSKQLNVFNINYKTNFSYISERM